MDSSLKNKAAKGVIWSALERFSVQGIQFVLGIIIARLVAPSEYGLIAMLNIFLAVAQSFIDSGFSNALIQKKNRTETDCSTVFYFNIVVAIGLYSILYVSSPYIAGFYKEPLLETITKWVGINIIVSAFSIVQRARLSIRLDFKTQAKASLIAVCCSGIIGVSLAYNDFGVWALVIQALLNNVINTILLWIFARWIPQNTFSYTSFKQLFSFGSKLMLSGFLHVIYANLYSLVIGRKYSATDVGYYNRMASIAQYPSINIVSIITRAIYPIQCSIQDEPEKLSTTFHQYLRMACYIVFPLMVGLSVIAEPLVKLLLTDKWLPAAHLLSILSIAHMWQPVMTINNQVLNVRGRSDYFLKAEIIKKIVAIAILIVTMPMGLTSLCIGILAYSFCDMAIIIYYSKKVIQTTYLGQVKEILPIFLLSLFMGGLVALITNFIEEALLQVVAGTLSGIIIVIVFSYLFRIKELEVICSILKISKCYKYGK
jgi:teichuronic acid exporter|uniref:lipopolysaccharide biosynthesis protein n=1 Tax=Phocaeicola coprophilus TaxID=387090 RepID=UPI003079CA50